MAIYKYAQITNNGNWYIRIILQNNSAKKSNFWLLKYKNFIGLRSVDKVDHYWPHENWWDWKFDSYKK